MGTYYPNLLATRILYDSDRSSASASDDGDVGNWVKTSKFILATLIGYDGKDTAASAYKLRWRNETDNPGGSFTDLAATGEMKYAASSAVLSDGTALTEANHRCTGPGGMTWQNGLESVNDNLVPDAGTFDLGSDCYTEFQWAIDPADAHYADQYTFQLYNNTEGAGDECLAQITIQSLDEWGTGTMSGSGTMTAAAIRTRLATGTMSGSGTMTADGFVAGIEWATGTMEATSSMTGAATRNRATSGTMTGSATMTASGTVEEAPAETRQVIIGGYYDDLNLSSTEYGVLQGGSTWVGTESYVTVPWPTSGKFTNLYVEVDNRLTAGGYTVTLRKNGADTALACAVTSGNLSVLDTDEVTVAAGDLICLKAAPNSPTGTPFANWGITFIPDIPGETVMCGVIDRLGTSSTTYAPFMCGAPYNFDSADNWAYYSVMPTPGTMKKLYARTTSTTTSGNYLDFTMYISTSGTALSARCGATNDPDTTDSIDIADANVLQMRVIETGDVADGYCRWAAVFVPDEPGEFVFAGQTTDNPTASTTEYNGLNGQFYSSVWDTDEDRYSMKASEDFTAKKIRVGAAYSPGTGKSRTLTLRRASTSDTSLAVTLSEGEIADSYSTDVSITAGWRLNIKHTDSGTPTSSQLQWSVLGYITPTGSPEEWGTGTMTGSATMTAAAIMIRQASTLSLIDNFEWGSDTDPITDSGGNITWQSNAPIGSSVVEIDTGQYHDGSRSVRMYRGDANWPYARMTIEDVDGKWDYKMWVRRDSPAGIHIRIGGSTYRVDVGCAASSGNYFYYTHSDSYVEPGGSMAYDTWQEWWIKDLDFTNGYFDFYVNGVKQGRWEMNTYGDYEHVFHIGPTGTTATIWMDQFSCLLTSSRMEAAAGRDRPGSGTTQGTSSMTGAATRDRASSGTMTGSATMTGEAPVRDRFTSGTMTGSAVVTGAAIRDRAVTGTMEATSSMTGAAIRDRASSGTMTGSGEMTAAAFAIFQASGTMAGTGVMTADGWVDTGTGEKWGTGTMGGTGAMTAAAICDRYVSATQFSDDFEWGTDGDDISPSKGRIAWSMQDYGPGSRCEIDTAQKYSGTRSFGIYKDQASDWPQGWFSKEAIDFAYNIHFMARVETGSSWVLAHGDGTHRIFVFNNGSSGQYGYYDHEGNYQLLSSYMPFNQWVEIELRHLDFTNGYYDLYADDVFIAHLPMHHDSQQTDTVAFGSDGAGTWHWYDDVRIIPVSSRMTAAGGRDRPAMGTMEATAAMSAAGVRDRYVSATRLLDDIERGNDGDPIDGGRLDWSATIPANCYVEIDTAQAHSGTRSILIQRDTISYPYAEFPLTGQSWAYSITWWHRRAVGGGSFNHSNGAKRIACGVGYNGYLYYYDQTGGLHYLDDYMPTGEWVALRVSDIDFTAGEYNFFYNDALVGRFPMWSHSYATNLCRFGVGANNGQVWLDDVEVVRLASKMTAAGIADLSASGTMTGSAEVTGAATRDRGVSGAMTGSGEMTGLGGLDKFATGTMAATASMTASGVRDLYATATLTGSASMIAVGYLASEGITRATRLIPYDSGAMLSPCTIEGEPRLEAYDSGAILRSIGGEDG